MATSKEFTPNPSQITLTKLIWHDPYVENLLAYGPSRSGKSAIFCANIISRALAYPGTKHGIFRLTLRSCHTHLFDDTFKDVCNRLHPGYLERSDVRVAKADNVIEFHNGSKVYFEGLDPSRIDKVLGAQYATAWVNECNEIKDYELIQQLASRMADTAPMVNKGKVVIGGDGNPVMCRPIMLYDCNPGYKSDWDYKCFKEKVHPSSGLKISDLRTWRSVFTPAYENERNLAAGYLDRLEARYQGSPFMAARFLKGMWSDDNPDALFRPDMFKYRAVSSDYLVRIIVAVDPAGSNGNNSDYTGIVVAGLGIDGCVYVLEDASLKGTPEQWATKVAHLYDKWDADLVVAEKNYGGQMVEHTIRTVRRNIPVKTVNATRGKLVRAEPIAMAYHQGKVYHTEAFKELESQMVDYNANSKKSPDRMDALVWGVSELLKLSGANAGFSMKAHGQSGVFRV